MYALCPCGSVASFTMIISRFDYTNAPLISVPFLSFFVLSAPLATHKILQDVSCVSGKAWLICKGRNLRRYRGKPLECFEDIHISLAVDECVCKGYGIPDTRVSVGCDGANGSVGRLLMWGLFSVWETERAIVGGIPVEKSRATHLS